MASKPLIIRKPTQAPIAGSQSQLPQDKPHVGFLSKEPNRPTKPPTKTDMDDHQESGQGLGRQSTSGNKMENESASPRSTIASFEDAYLSDAVVDGLGANPTRAVLESHNRSSDTSSVGMIGDFVPVELQVGGRKRTNTERQKMSFATKNVPRKVPQIVNPYEFDLESPYIDQNRQTRFADFVNSFDATPYFSPQPSYITTFDRQVQAQVGDASPRPASLVVPIDDRGGYNLRRSDSSPSVMPQPFPRQGARSPSPDVLSSYRGDEFLAGTFSPSWVRNEDRGRHGRYPEDEYSQGSPTHHVFHTSFRNRDHRSPEHRPNQVLIDRNVKGSPTRILDDVVERAEEEVRQHSRKLSADAPEKRSRSPMKRMFAEKNWLGTSTADNSSLTKPVVERDARLFSSSRSPDLRSESSPMRSRSPMKKMFGENGWLGNSPSEINEHKFRAHNVTDTAKQSELHKKTTMIGKIKIKFEEMAEKADLSPMRGFRNEDKHPKISVLAISLGQPEQARILMEIELMVVHTANCFIMSQFSQGRMAIDSIKKIVDMWRSKGRPPVTEFMYDQATQRALVVANQHNFRFHGGNAVSDVRIASMLYNWKNVASLMAVRTFCVADTVLIKLVFDVEQILELLGAGEPILLRLQGIRAVINEMMRLARQTNTKSVSTLNSRTGRGTGWSSAASTRSPHRSQSTDHGSRQGSHVPDNLHILRA